MSEENVEQSSTPEQTNPETSAEQTSPEQTSVAESGPVEAAAQSAPAGPAAAERQERGHRKTRRGYVVSDKMNKTVVVEVEDRVKHPLYGKVLRRSEKVKAHDETNDCGVGDLVVISETRPLSATKRWRVLEILERAK